MALVSDFYESPDQIVEAIRPLAGMKHDIMAFHVLDPHEIEFPFDAPATQAPRTASRQAHPAIGDARTGGSEESASVN